jgi:hypothetical protein
VSVEIRKAWPKAQWLSCEARGVIQMRSERQTATTPCWLCQHIPSSAEEGRRWSDVTRDDKPAAQSAAVEGATETT